MSTANDTSAQKQAEADLRRKQEQEDKLAADALGRALDRAQVRLAVAILISALGVMHLLRGLGLIKLGLLG